MNEFAKVFVLCPNCVKHEKVEPLDTIRVTTENECPNLELVSENPFKVKHKWT
jgi:hypothetical protein